jgi:hypothetical protein
MGAAHRYCHPANFAGNGVAAKWRTVQRLYRYALAKAQFTQPFAIGGRQGRPVDRRNARGLAKWQVIKTHENHPFIQCGYLRVIINIGK